MKCSTNLDFWSSAILRLLILAFVVEILAANPSWVVAAVRGVFSFQATMNRAVDHLYQEGL